MITEDEYTVSPDDLSDRYTNIRSKTEDLCAPLEAEDFTIAPTHEIGSPAKWHLAHTSWFFETFVLSPHFEGYKLFHPRFSYLFNSYYIAVGDRHTRSLRGSVSRPTIGEVFEYRKYVDNNLKEFLAQATNELVQLIEPVITIGLQHEQQHQELMLCDIKHIFWNNPTFPSYRSCANSIEVENASLTWLHFNEDLYSIGHEGSGFSFDNEKPKHRQFVPEFEIGSRLVTNAEYLEFMEDDGYSRGEFWLDLGWDKINDDKWGAPFYWHFEDHKWFEMTLSGMRALDPSQPVSHVSYFEADAYARWAGARLPREADWEVASAASPIEGNFSESEIYHPLACRKDSEEGKLHQAFGDLWEWTQSHYSPYPGYQAPPGALGEYNGKFMCNKFVLRGGSCITPQSHVRLTYRNFFSPETRWPFTGIRLARDC